jgi:hypothetical protein
MSKKLPDYGADVYKDYPCSGCKHEIAVIMGITPVACIKCKKITGNK